MPANGREREFNQRFNAPMSVWLPRLMHKHNDKIGRVAMELGVYSNTVNWWLKKIGYTREMERAK